MFYLIEVAEGDKAIAGKAIYQYETEQQAVAAWHDKLGTAGRSDLYTHSVCAVMDEHGAIYRSEEVVKPAAAAVPEA